MAKPYFRQVPNFQYVNRKPGDNSISNYEEVKNIFKRAKLREDIFSDLTFFTKYTIVGNERPDNVANKFYKDPTLDWVVLLSNNILNIQTEWPLQQSDFNDFLLDKYGDYETIGKVHHYECTGVKNEAGVVVAKAGLIVPSDFSVTFYDSILGQTVTRTNVTEAVTNYQYETKIQDDKRNIYVLKATYLPIIKDDIDALMPYRKGGTQYVSPTMKKADNIKLFE